MKYNTYNGLFQQVLEHYSRTGYLSATPEEQSLFRQQLSQWMTALCMQTEPEKVCITFIFIFFFIFPFCEKEKNVAMDAFHFNN